MLGYFFFVLFLSFLGFLLFIPCAVFFARLDCDLTLYLFDKLGKSPASLRGKIVWITGASSGIGQGIALCLAKYGCKLVLSGTNVDRLEKVASQCKEIGEEDVITVAFDIRDFPSHQIAFEKVINHFKKIDILINNAGRSQRAYFGEIEIDLDMELFKINTFGPINLTRIVLNHWTSKDQSGQLAVISSAAGKMGAPFSCTYTGSKHALQGYFECLRMETAGKNIAINMICPGPIVSSILENAFGKSVNDTISLKHPPDMKKVSTERCAHLTAVSIANNLSETWISYNPILGLFYAIQYFPSITRTLISFFITPQKLEHMRDGGVRTFRKE